MSALDTSSEDRIEADLRAVEYELRADGRLSFATCEVLRCDDRLAGLEPALRFLRCTVFAVDPETPALPRRRRVQACRLMLLSLGAHTPSPRWTSIEIEQLVESAMAIPGAQLSDLAQAQFALLGETSDAMPTAQKFFLSELGRQIADKRRLGHSAEDFVWIAVRLADPVLPHTSAQAFFAAHTLPPKLRPTPQP